MTWMSQSVYCRHGECFIYYRSSVQIKTWALLNQQHRWTLILKRWYSVVAWVKMKSSQTIGPRMLLRIRNWTVHAIGREDQLKPTSCVRHFHCIMYLNGSGYAVPCLLIYRYSPQSVWDNRGTCLVSICIIHSLDISCIVNLQSLIPSLSDCNAVLPKCW